MGIPKFYRWFRDQPSFNATVSRQHPGHVDIFAFDANGLIHKNAQEVFGYGEKAQPGKVKILTKEDYEWKRSEVFRLVFEDIIKLTEMIHPQRSLIIAIDGVAPQAKINQQRNRRYKSASTKPPEQFFDPNVISPGTDFMRHLDEYMQRALERDKEKLPPHVIYSGCLVPGEGEQKIATHLRQMVAQGQTVVVYGMDADLIMIYLMLLNDGWKNIYLFREDTKTGSHQYRIKAMIDLNMLRTIIQKMYPGVEAPVDDFVVILFFNGNDFLPHFPVFERTLDTLNVLIGGYRDFLKENPGTGICSLSNIIWKNLILFLEYIVAKYNKFLLEKWALNKDHLVAVPSTIAEASLKSSTMISGKEVQTIQELDLEKFNRLWYQYIFSPKTGTGEVVPSESDIRKLNLKYAEGVAWVYTYYKFGVRQLNVEWYYPYHYAPLLSDLPNYMKAEVSPVWEIEPIQIQNEYLSPLEQLMMIMPPASRTGVPAPIQILYSENSPIIDLLPVSFVYDAMGKMDERLGVAILPFPNPMRVIRAVQSLNLPESYLSVYQAHEPLVIERSLVQILKPRRVVYEGRGGPRRGGPTYEGRGRGGRGGSTYRGRGMTPEELAKIREMQMRATLI